MADTGERVRVDFRTEPAKYRHWKLTFNGPVATLAMDVKEDGGLRPGYELKLNSYDLGVDVELYDAIQRLRFEHPEVGAVVVTSGKERVFCAGANIRMLSQSAHGWKVNFCKFTNETRNAIEEATGESRQFYLCAVNGPCAGGGYELALATDWIVMADDGNTAVSLPEVPLLAVLPGTGGLTRLVDKRRVRRDRADFFCTVEEGIKGARAVEWGLVDESRAALEARRGREASRRRVRGAHRSAGRSPRHRAGSARALDRRRPDPLWPRRLRDRPRARSCRDHGERAERGAADRRRRRPRGRRRVLAAGTRSRARRSDPAPAHQRGRDRTLGAQDVGSRRSRRGVRSPARGAPRGLARARDPSLSQAHVQADRGLVAVGVRARRAGLVLCRHAPGARARRRPLVHARRLRGRATRARRRRSGSPR